MRRGDKARGEGVRVEELPVVEDAAHRRQRGLDEESDLLAEFPDGVVVLGEPSVHLVLELLQSLRHGVSAQKIVAQDGVGPTPEADPLC